MKNMILLFACLIFTLSGYPHTEEDPTYKEPTATEISKNRACFRELSQNGCGDPGDDLKHFRSCLNNVFPTLTSDCQRMMTKLYGRRR